MFTRKKSLTRMFIPALIFLVVSGFNVPLFAEQEEAASAELESYFALLEEELPLITTGASRPVKKEIMPATVTVITADELKLLGLRHLTDVINYIVPGGVGDIHRSQRSGLYCFRGISVDNNGKYIFMIDGYNCSFLTTWGAFNERYLGLLDELDRIEITQGVGSTLYGSGATSGVINFITKTGESFQGTEITTGYGSYHRSESSIKFGKKTADDRHEFYYFGYKQSKGTTPEGGGWSDGSTSDLRKRNRDNHADPGRRWDHFAPSFKFHANIKKDDFTLRARYVQDMFEEPYTSGNYQGVTRYMMNTADTYWFQNYFFVQPEITRKLSENSRIKANLAFEMHESGRKKVKDWYSNDLNDDGTRTFIAEKGTRTETHGERKIRGQLFHYYDGWANHKLTSGVELFWMHSGPDFGGKNNQVKRESTGTSGVDRVFYREDSERTRPESLCFAAAFTEDIWQIGEKSTLFASVRLEDHSKTSLSVTPRVALSHNLSKKTTLKAIYNHGYRTPNWAFIAGNEDSGYPKPEPERVRSFEAHILHKFNSKLSTSVIGYYTIYKGLTGWWSGHGYYNYPKVKAAGLEISGDYRTENLKLKVSHSFSQPVDIPDDNFDILFLSYDGSNWAMFPTHMTKAQALINLVEDKCILGLTYLCPWGIKGQRNVDPALKEASHHLNATLTLKLKKNLEFQATGYNITGENSPWWGSRTYDGNSRDVIAEPQFFLRLIWRF